jgi:hypothetical protein
MEKPLPSPFIWPGAKWQIILKNSKELVENTDAHAVYGMGFTYCHN